MSVKMMKYHKSILLSILLLTSSSSLSFSMSRELPPSFEIEKFSRDLSSYYMNISADYFDYRLIENSVGVLSGGDYSSKLKQEEISISKSLRTARNLVRIKLDSIQKISSTYPIRSLLRGQLLYF